MDGGGRLDQSMMRSGLSEVGEAGTSMDEPAFARVGAPRRRFFWMAYRGLAGRWRSRLKRLPSGIGIAGSVLLFAGALGYGVVKGQHVPDLDRLVQGRARHRLRIPSASGSQRFR